MDSLPAFVPTLTALLAALRSALLTLGGEAQRQPLSFSLCVVGALSLATYLVPWLLSFLTHTSHGARTLKARYAAEWAVVTGGSSGIGLSLCRRLAAQGLHIVMVAVPDALLQTSAAALRKEFPGVQVRAVGLDLGRDASTYIPQLAAATADISVGLVFNNAGYIVTGFFADTPLERWLANALCNAVAPIAITHLFLARMRAEGRKGCITFTSSPANIIPSPFSTLYGCTKSMVTHFASSLACELGPEGIDVCVIHPSPVATRFYTGTHALPTLKMFQSTATGPDHVADVLLRAIGRNVIVDQGYYPPLLKVLLRVIELNWLTDVMKSAAGGIADYKVLRDATTAAAAVATAAASAKAVKAATPSAAAKAASPSAKAATASSSGSARKKVAAAEVVEDKPKRRAGRSVRR